MAQNHTIHGRKVIEGPLDERILISSLDIPNYSQQMRILVETINSYAKEQNPEFLVTVRDAESLFHKREWERKLEETQRAEMKKAFTSDDVFLVSLFDGPVSSMPVGSVIESYLNSIDGIFFSDILCSDRVIDNATMKLISSRNISVFSIESCTRLQTKDGFPASYERSRIVPKRDPVNNNPGDIKSLSQVKNYLIIKDNSFYKAKAEILDAFSESNFDMLIINPLFRKNLAFNKDEIDRLKIKKIGGRRLLLAYFNVSVINENSYFWKKGWKLSDPKWIRLRSPFEENHYIVEYWSKEWHALVSEYLYSVLRLGFDGIFLDGTEYFYKFELLTPI